MPDPQPSFESVLADLHGQYDPDSELLPHLVNFGPPADSEWVCVQCGYHNSGPVCAHCGRPLVVAGSSPSGGPS